MGKVIGIDLGTSASCVAIMENGKAKVIENAEGSRTTPSIVAFTDKEQLVGSNAKRQATTNSENTIFDVKRLIGRRADDLSVIAASKLLPYKVVNSDNGDAWVEIKGKKMSPQEISAAILEKMKKTAEDYLGEKVTEAVITCPAYFNDAQRQATKDAGRIAGLDVLRVISEPTAGAMAFGLDKKDVGKVVVADLGGGTWDVSVLDIQNGVFEVLATNGDNLLGGSDFDNKIIDFLVNEFNLEQGIDLRKDKLAVQRLKDVAEKAKIELSSALETEINLPYITADASGPKHLVIKLTRSKFESMIIDLLVRMIKPCEMVLNDSKIKKSDINEIILVGGSTRVPAVQNELEKFFGIAGNKSVNPDEAVALGAAIQAGVLKGDVKDVLLLDVTPLSLGIETMGGIFTRLIERNTTIPVKKSQIFSTASDNQSSVTIKVSQGEREMSNDNKLLGQFDLTGLPPARRGTPQIEVSFDISSDGIVAVSAKDKATGKEQQISIKSNGGLSDIEIQEMVKQAELNRDADVVKKTLVEARNNADGAIGSVERQIEEGGEGIDTALVESVNAAKLELKTVMENSNSTADEIKSATDKLQKASMDLGASQYAKAQESTTDQSNPDTDTDQTAS